MDLQLPESIGLMQPCLAGLERDLLALVDPFNRSGDGTMVVPSEYLEVIVTRA